MMHAQRGYICEKNKVVIMANENTQLPKSKKDSYLESFRAKHPDWKDDDEEGFYGALAEDDASSAEKMSGYEEREKQLTDALSGNAMNAALFVDAMDGTPVPLALLKRFPEEIKAWMDDPENAEALEKTFADHAGKIEENRKLQEEKDKNNAETNAMLDGLVDSGEYTEDEINECLKYLGTIAVGLMADKCEKEWIDFARKAINHDTDVQAARSEGEIAGRNANITAQRKDSQKGGNTHSGLGTANAAMTKAPAVQPKSNKRDMWAGAKINKLN